MKTAEEIAKSHEIMCDDGAPNYHTDRSIVASMKEYANQFKQDKPLLGLAKTSELIYELSARCDTGSIDKGGDYRTCDY